MKHKHYTEIVAWADGETVQAFDTALLTWVDLSIYIEPSWHPNIQYRIKQESENFNKFIKVVDEKYNNIIYYIRKSCYNSLEFNLFKNNTLYIEVDNLEVNYKLICFAEVIIDTDRNTVIKSRNGFECLLDKLLLEHFGVE